jgi:hypothetical protein
MTNFSMGFGEPKIQTIVGRKTAWSPSWHIKFSFLVLKDTCGAMDDWTLDSDCLGLPFSPPAQFL